MKPIAFTALAATSGLAVAGGLHGNLTIDVSGVQFFDARGSPNNEFITLISDVDNTWITDISWDVNLTPVTAPGGVFPSWASEATISFNDTILLNVGLADTFGVVNQSYTGSVSTDIKLNRNELLNLEFWESFDDAQGEPDAFFEAGSSITLHGTGSLRIIPGSGTLAPLAMIGLAISRRRR